MIKFSIGILMLLLFAATMIFSAELQLLPHNLLMVATAIVSSVAGAFLGLGVVEMRYEVDD